MPRVSHASPLHEPARRAVARDTATILAAALFAIVIGQLAGLTATGGAGASFEPPGSEEVIGVASGDVVPTLPPLDTIGAIVDPSAGLDATPTPIPIITLGPPTPSPSGGPSVSPTASRRPTPRPTVKPTAGASSKPSASVPPPPLVADFTCNPPTGAYTIVTGTCSAAVTGAVGALTYAWTIDGAAAGTAASQAFTFDTNGDHSISLSVTDGLGRSDSKASCCWSVTVIPPS